MNHSLDPNLQTELIELYRKALRTKVPLGEVESEVKKYVTRMSVSTSTEKVLEKKEEHKLASAIPLAVRWGAFFLPLLFIAVGLFLVGNAVVPILSYYFQELPIAQATRLTSPIPLDQVLDVTPVMVVQAAEQEKRPVEPKVIDTELDFTNLSNWFSPEVVAKLSQEENAEDEFFIDIPAVKIEKARVKIGGTNLNENLIAYPGTALPGNPGAPVVFGHSVLRQFYYPSYKNPKRYTSIFSYIMTLKKGDQIIVTYKDVSYTYIVTDKTEVKPEDVYILSQQYDSRQLKLVTCVPEGTYLRRGVVTAQLVQPEE
jgi:LPXTG-site transpeptidase (sortase) family protein